MFSYTRNETHYLLANVIFFKSLNYSKNIHLTIIAVGKIIRIERMEARNHKYICIRDNEI